MFIDVKDTSYPLDKEKAMTHLPPHPRALTIAHEDVVKVAMQLKDNLITRGEMNAQMLSIVIDMKVALRNEFIGEIMDKLGDIEQLFSDVQGEVDNLDFITE
jgi:hypothetical protein